MVLDKKVLALIPARGGSKGIKNKNIIDLCNKPLIAYSIEAAKKSRYIDRVIISTDSAKIAEVAISYGAEVPFMRPAELAADTAKTIDSVIHAVNEMNKKNEIFDILVLLQPTQPLRTAEDIDGAIEKFISCKEQGVVSVSEVSDHPSLIRSIDSNGHMERLLTTGSTIRRQDMVPYYRVNGCVYVNSISDINSSLSFNDNPIPYIMQKEHSVDIDALEDLAVARYYIDNKI